LIAGNVSAFSYEGGYTLMTALAVILAFFGAMSTGGHVGGKVYVDNSAGDDLSVIDIATMKSIGSVKVGEHPHGLTASPDGNTLYVSIEGTGELVAIDTRSDQILWRIPVGSKPNEISITHDGRFIFIPLLFNSEIAVVDVSLRKVVDHLKVARFPHNTFASFNGRRIYVGSVGANTITVIDAETRKTLYEIDTGAPVRPIAISRDESVAYAQLSGLHGFVIIDLNQRKVLRQVQLPPLPAGTPKPDLDTYSHGIALTPDQHELYVTSVPGNAVFVFSVPQLQQIAKIEVGQTPDWLAVESSGSLVFVSNTLSNSVSVIDVHTKRVVATVPVGLAPKRILAVQPQ
jgi:YVTN family beta-propeller protein